MSVNPYITELMNNGNITEVIKVIEGSNDSTQRACLLIAAAQNNLDIIKYLENISNTSEIFLIACANNSMKIIEYLISLNNLPDSAIFQGLEKAGEKGHTDIFIIVYEYAKSRIFLAVNNKLIQIACINKKWNIAEYMLDQIDIHSNLLVIGTKLDNVQMVKNIIDSNYIPKDTRHRSEAFSIAVSKGNIEIIKLLYFPEIDPDLLDIVTIKAIQNKNIKIVKVLVNLDRDYFSANMVTFVEKAVISNDIPMVDYLFSIVQNGIDIENLFAGALYEAANNGNLDMVKHLISLGLNPGIMLEDNPEDDFSVLEAAAASGQLNIVQYLIENHREQVILRQDEAIDVEERNNHQDVVKYLESV